MKRVEAIDNLKADGKCRFYSQRHCKFGDLCKHSHADPPGEVTASPTARMPVRAFEMILPSVVLIESVLCRHMFLRLKYRTVHLVLLKRLRMS